MITPWIENVSFYDIKNGDHYDAGENSMLIQIVDPGVEFPTPKYQFKEVRQFYFLDVEDDDKEKLYYSAAVTDEDAKGLAEALKYALANHMNVVVHCHMGVCRSGAVAAVGEILGFMPTEKFKVPNLMVKNKMLKYLGLGYDVKTAYTNQEAYDEFNAYHNKHFKK